MSLTPNFDHFMTEIQSLDIRFKERFVDGRGRIVPDYDPAKHAALLERHTDWRIIRYRSLDHYHYKNKEDNYSDYCLSPLNGWTKL
ncbi:hypothetical protein GCM10027299_58570 [Larkinella ripae]